jgi:regulator of protease activity HflC (stomatin/prohibitin superfamily)
MFLFKVIFSLSLSLFLWARYTVASLTIMSFAWLLSPTFVVGILVILVLSQCFVVLNASETVVLECLGKYTRTLRGGGIFFALPFFERPHRFEWSWSDTRDSERLKIETRYSVPNNQITVNPPMIRVCTSENYAVDVDIKFYVIITNAEEAAYLNRNPILALYTISQSTLLSLASSMNYDSMLREQVAFSEEMCVAMNKDAAKFGLEVVRVVVERIIADKDVQAETRRALTELKSLALGMDIEKRRNALELLKETNLSSLEEAQNRRIIIRAEAEATAHTQRFRALHDMGVDLDTLLRNEMERDRFNALSSLTSLTTLAITTTPVPPNMHIHTQQQ